MTIMKTIIYNFKTYIYAVFLLSITTGFSQECENFENPNSIINWEGYQINNLSVISSLGSNTTNHLYFVDDGGPSIAVNDVDFSGNWNTIAQDSCLCFDYRVVWGNEPITRRGPKVMIYRFDSGYGDINSVADWENFADGNIPGLRASFVPNVSNPIIQDNVWNQYCLPLDNSSGNLPSNSFGNWVIFEYDGNGNGTTPLSGSAALNAWNSLISNVGGLILPADYHSSPSEEVSFDNFCWNCTGEPSEPDPCCSIEDFDASIQENNGTFDVSISGGNTPLQEVEISMVDYHIEYAEEDCKPDDLGIFGTLTTTTTSLENLVLNPGDNGTSSLTWMLGNPSVINSSVNLDILNPEVLNLECCEVEFYFCLKVKVSNVDCDDCETIICYSSEDSQDTDDPKPCEINIDPLEDSYCVGDEINLNWNTNTTGNLSIVITDGNNIWNTVDNNVSSSQNSYQYTIPSSIDCDKDWYFNISFNDYDGECWSSSTKFRVDCCDDQNLDCECGKWLDDSIFIKGYQKRIPRDPNQKINLKSNFEDKVKCGKKIKLNPSLNYTFKAPNYLCNPEDCEVEYKWEIVGENGNILSGSGQIINYTFNNPGDYSITYTPICDGKKCKPCRIGISIPETD